MTSNPPVIVWFHADLRVTDHPALAAACRTGHPVVPVYVLEDDDAEWAPGGASLWWLHHSLASLIDDLKKLGSLLVLRRGSPALALQAVADEIGADCIFASRPFEPAGIDAVDQLRKAGLKVDLSAANLLYEPGSVLTESGTPYKVFTPFHKACLGEPDPPKPLAPPDCIPAPVSWPDSDSLDDWALLPTRPDWAGGLREAWQPGEAHAAARLDDFLEQAVEDYGNDRNRPDVDGSSRLSPYLHFGEISARQVWHRTAAHPNGGSSGAASFLRELAWREFSAHLLFHFPEMPAAPLRQNFAGFPWSGDDDGFAAWTRGETGYPFVDAGMRQLWHTGWMHNRVRMITASFLVKHLRIDWRRGEEWFWDTLVDADLANNSASWQWVAGCGTDAAPYFRIFNPITQAGKFDPDGDYIRKWVPELADVPDKYLGSPWEMPAIEREAAGIRLGDTYPFPIVDHGDARKAALAAFDEIKA